MTLFRRPPRPKNSPDPAPPRDRKINEDGTNAVRRKPDPQAEPIPDGEHKYVPRSPYRTGNW